ncbi:hypothetical protein ACFP81_08800 [Deinococcus lacus]|uniref:Uncharacterized protein n=1 Tax=Deinococcus lacus TaxID=392561 RepID=A0ABW1YCU9_9DEIO
MPSLRPLIFVAALLAPAALAAQSAPLPTLTLNAAPIGRTAKVERVAGVPYFESASAMQALPEHLRATLNVRGQTWKPAYPGERPPAYVAVFPVAALKSHYPAATEVAGQVDELVTIAKGGSFKVERQGVGVRGLPFLPTVNAAQVVAGSVARVSSSDVQGLRYLTIHAQDLFRYSREDVTYTFQGVTRDGKYVVVMHMPYAPASLPTAAQVQQEEKRNGPYFPVQASEAQWNQITERYLTALTTKLDAEGRAGRLAPLDAVVKSIRVR